MPNVADALAARRSDGRVHPIRVVTTRASLGIAAVALIWAAAWLAILHAPPAAAGTVSLAAAFDFSVTASVALYLIAVRPGHLPRWTLGATIAIGLAMGRHAPAAAAALELVTVAWLAIRGRRAYRAWRIARASGVAVEAALVEAFVAARLPARVAAVLATEVALVSLLATGWRKPTSGAFTVHRNSGWALYAGVLVFLVLVETAALHVVLAMYASAVVAWIATALSIYSALWFVGDVLALRHGGAIVGERALELRIGVRWRGTIPWRAIASVTGPGASRATDISILGANVVLELREPCELVGLLGRRRMATAIALSIDDREAFVSAVSTHLS